VKVMCCDVSWCRVMWRSCVVMCRDVVWCEGDVLWCVVMSCDVKVMCCDVSWCRVMWRSYVSWCRVMWRSCVVMCRDVVWCEGDVLRVEVRDNPHPALQSVAPPVEPPPSARPAVTAHTRVCHCTLIHTHELVSGPWSYSYLGHYK